MKILLDTIGCRLNQSEIEMMARGFRAAGHEITAEPGEAALAVVNTCAVTAGAASDSRGRLRQLARAGVGQIIATGCWATLQPGQAAALPGVSRVIDNDHKDRLVAEALGASAEPFDLEPIVRSPLPGLHHRTRAFIKVQDGCDNHCTFCVTTIARGAARSRSAADVLADIQYALQGGAKEIVLTGVHLGSWGRDLGSHLRELVAIILRESDAPRLRLSSLEPWDLDADFFRLWQDARLCPHLHLPLQSGCAATLKRMARKTTPGAFRELASAARAVVPEIALTTDVIAGFPGESAAEFEESLAFVREMGFAGGHAFTYSPRPGTAAARMPAYVPPRLAQERNAAYRLAFEQGARAYRARFAGRTAQVLWESAARFDEQGWHMQGHTGNYLKVGAVARSARWNEFDLVRLGDAGGEVLQGVICNSG
jgi:threonylcarbamoyladenosine tRNA methylthiotransferase MtaB